MPEEQVETTETNTEQQEQTEQQEEQNEQVTFQSQSEFDSFMDKRISKALEKNRTKMEKEFREQIEAERKEAERLAKLSQKEREEAEFQKRQDALDKREQELAKKELKAQAITELHQKELPSNFADFLLADDADATFANINTFKKTFDEAIEKAVNERLKGNPPSVGNTNSDAVTKEQFQKMSYMERTKLYQNDIETYNKLTKGE
jgi:CRISPR/Cas system-associated protein endoribonuclease Cas2